MIFGAIDLFRVWKYVIQRFKTKKPNPRLKVKVTLIHIQKDAESIFTFGPSWPKAGGGQQTSHGQELLGDISPQIQPQVLSLRARSQYMTGPANEPAGSYSIVEFYSCIYCIWQLWSFQTHSFYSIKKWKNADSKMVHDLVSY